MAQFKCKKCEHVFIIPDPELEGKELPKCPKCGSEDVQKQDSILPG